MKKLTLVLVALLLALTCVFVACGKKNETPVDNTDPKPVDNTPAPVETPTVEDMTPVAEQFKKDLAANYVDLYSKEVETAIDAEKAAALLKIMGASTKEEAQKIADEFIAFLKAQKTSYDVLKDLVAQIGDVALADEDLIKEAAAYVEALSKAYAGTNDAKKAVLDAFKADKTIKDTVEKMSLRLMELAAIKEAADDKENGVNGKTIADLKKTFTRENYPFTMASYDLYEEAVAAVEAAAKNTSKLKIGDNENVKPQTGAIAADSEAYAEIFDVATLAEMKALLDAAIAAKPVLSDLKAIIEDYDLGNMPKGVYGMSARFAVRNTALDVDFLYNGPENCTMKCLDGQDSVLICDPMMLDKAVSSATFINENGFGKINIDVI